MNEPYPQTGGVPRPNTFYPMANMRGSAYSAPLGFNQSSEVLSGYDAQINPMTGQENPQVNFAGGGIASLVASPYRDSDVMQVKMTPREVAGLQQLAVAYGATPADLYDPVTGQPQFSFLKKILPMIAGAVLPSIPGVGQFAKTIGFGSEALGTSLLVGGVTGLIEGDLKKGLEAGLGAYSGATLASGLAASQRAAAEASRVTTAVPPPAGTFKDISKTIEPTPSSYMKSSESSLTGKPTIASIGGGMGAAIDRTPPAPPPVSIKPSLTGGIRGLFTQEGREAFGKALGGGFESPLAQNLSRYATFAGAAIPFAEQPKAFPTGGAGEDIVYIPGERNPLYGTGRDQPYMLPGQYYKRTSQGMVPYNPWQLAPGYGQTPGMPQRGTGPKGRGFADGGVVAEEVGMLNPFRGDRAIVGGAPGFVPAYATSTAAPVMMQGPINIPAYAAPTTDPNVLATRAYIEELNRRVRLSMAPPAGEGAGRGGLSSFGGMGLPIPSGGAGAGVGGAAGPSTGDIVGGLATSYLLNKGVESGLGYLKDKIFTDPTVKQAQETPITDGLQGVDLSTLPATQAALAALSPFNIPVPPQYSVEVEEVPDATTEPPAATQPAATSPATSAIPFTSPLLSPFVAPPPSPIYSVGVEELTTPEVQQPAQVGADLSKPLSSYLSGASALGSGLAGLAGAGKAASIAIEMPVYDALGNLVGFSAAPGAAGAASAAGGAGASGAAGAAGEAGAEAAKAGLGKSAIIPGLQTVLGAYETFKGIESGKESQAALGGLGLGAGLAGLGGAGVSSLSGLAALGAGPVGIAAAALAAIGASMVNTKEFGDVALRNYWNAIDEGRGFGQAPPEELAQGFINFYRTNKNEFPGQAKYGRTGNEDFVYDMTQVINDAVKSGKVGKDVDAPTLYKEVVQPWLNTMGEGPKDADARRIQDFMMTDLIYNFMQGRPISNAQVKGDKNFKIVSEKPVYAGATPELNRTIGGQEIPEDVARKMYLENNVRQEDLNSWAMSNPIGRMQALGQMPIPQSPYVAPEEPATIMPVGEQEFITPYVPNPTGEIGGLVPIGPEQQYEPSVEMFTWPDGVQRPFPPPPEIQAPSQQSPAPQPISTPITAYEEPVYVPREEPTFINPYAEERFIYTPEFGEYAFAGGGAIGEGFNFGFAHGGQPTEYKAGGKFLRGPGDGMSDDIHANIEGRQEARLADGEFVIPADVVSHLGNGSSNAGAKKLHQMMARVRQVRTGKKKQAPAIKMDRYLPA